MPAAAVGYRVEYFRAWGLSDMSFFSDLFRDARDDVYRDLLKLGVDASTGPLGAIDIAEGPIRWVNVRKEQKGGPQIGYRTIHYTDYGVPDQRILGSRSVWIKSIRLKTFPLFGKVQNGVPVPGVLTSPRNDYEPQALATASTSSPRVVEHNALSCK